MPNLTFFLKLASFTFNTCPKITLEGKTDIASVRSSNYFLQTYYSLVLYLLLAALVCTLLATLAYLFSLSAVQDSEKKSEYECGFEPFDSATRLPFDVHFYLVGILFLIFDVEIALLFPWVRGLHSISWFGFYLRRGFIFILSIGFLYEWKRGALIWPSRQQESVYKAQNGFNSDIIWGLVPYSVKIVWPYAIKLVLYTAPAHPWIAGAAAVKNLYDQNKQVAKDKAMAAAAKQASELLCYQITIGGLVVIIIVNLACFFHYMKTAIFGTKTPTDNPTDIAFEKMAVVNTKELSDNNRLAWAFLGRFLVGAVTSKISYYFRTITKRLLGFIIIRAILIRYRLRQIIKYLRGPWNFRPVFLAGNAETEEAWARRLIDKTVSYANQRNDYLIPEIILRCLVVHALTLLSRELGRESNKFSLAYFSLLGRSNGLSFVTGTYLTQLIIGDSNFFFNGYLRTSFYVTARELLALVSCRFVLNNSRTYLKSHSQHLLEYAIIFVLTVLFRRLLIRAANFRSAFRTVVGFSLNLYVLILFDAAKGNGREAGVKYYFLSTFSSGLRIYGIFLILVLIGTLQFFETAQNLRNNPELSKNAPARIRVALGLLLTGIFFKLSAFPGHLWAAEVYEGSSDPVTAFFRLPTKIAVLSFLFSAVAVARSALSSIWQPFLRVSAARSLFWGALGALAEKNTKRFLAYASINQIGFLLLGLATAAFSGFQATQIYLFVYSLRNFGFLTIFLASRRSQRYSLLYLTDFRGLGQQNWLLSWSSAIRLFSRAGIPPLAGFFGKYYLLLHVQQKKLYVLVIIPLLTSLPSAYYYLRVVKTLWFEGARGRTKVTCELSFSQQVILYVSEGFLWIFGRFSGLAVAFSEFSTQSLIAPNA